MLLHAYCMYVYTTQAGGWELHVGCAKVTCTQVCEPTPHPHNTHAHTHVHCTHIVTDMHSFIHDLSLLMFPSLDPFLPLTLKHSSPPSPTYMYPLSLPTPSMHTIPSSLSPDLVWYLLYSSQLVTFLPA